MDRFSDPEPSSRTLGVSHADGLADPRVRLGALVLLLAGEALFVSLRYDAWGATAADAAWWLRGLDYAGYALKAAIAFVVALLLAVGPNLRTHYQALSPTSAARLLGRIVPQLAAFAAFLLVTDAIFSEQTPASSIPAWLPALWLGLLLTVVALALRLVAPADYWANIASREGPSIVIAVLVAAAALTIAIASQQLWGPLSDLTFSLTSSLLGMIYPDVVMDADSRVLGTATFRVSIAAACSGYEGIGLVVVFTALILSLFRADFRFPHALLLFPIGVATIWTFNALRIVLLIMIGHGVSPEIAVGGFHSQAGWISFVLVAVGLLACSYRIPFFRAGPASRKSSPNVNIRVAYLLPLVALLAATLLTSALSADIDWLYPLRVAIVGAVILAVWRRCNFVRQQLSWVAVAAGAGVFLLWIALVPADSTADASIAGHLGEASFAVATLWIVLRFIGSAITVPIAEELAFRGYLLATLTRGNPTPDQRLPFSWIALLASSAVFGLMHTDWMAGALAGLAFGLVRYHRGRVMDAVVAHAVTNALLSAYVLTTGHWSLW